MAEIIHWQDDADQATTVRQASLLLDRGELVAFPTATGVGVAASALQPRAVDRLGRFLANGDRLTLALPSAGHASDWVPAMGPLARRLTRRLWPGFVTILFADGWKDGLSGRLDPSVRERLCAAGQLGVVVPDHPPLWYTLLMVPGPVLLASTSANGWNDGVPLAIADPGRRVAPSVVRIEGEKWEVLNEGAVTRADLQDQARCRIVFVCTGNTCRSPMAAALCRKLLADRLGCGVEQLAERGYEVTSAGVAAVPGEPAATEAIDAVRDHGAELAGHASRPLTPDLARHADFLIAMTRGHQGAILSRFAPSAHPRTLCPHGTDVADPIGAGPEVYRRCAQDILRHLEHWIVELERPCA